MSNKPNAQFGFGGFGSNFGGPPPMMLPMGYYLNLLTSEYKAAANLQAFMNVVLSVYQDASFLFASFVTAFDVRYAVGPQLDMLGVLIGASRTVPFQPSNGVSPVLTDDAYRTFLLARIAFNSWDGLIDSLNDIWKTLFPGGRITVHDNQNMTATVFLSGSFSSIVVDLITNGFIVPRPETVQYTYTFATEPIFGFDRNDTYVSGFEDGHWS